MSVSGKNNDSTVWVVISNSDLTEGRGSDVPIAVCDIEATGLRLAKKKGVMGSDAEVRRVKVAVIDGIMHIPLWCVGVHYPTSYDIVEQERIDSSRAAYEKALAAGLTEDEINALCAHKGR